MPSAGHAHNATTTNNTNNNWVVVSSFVNKLYWGYYGHHQYYSQTHTACLPLLQKIYQDLIKRNASFFLLLNVVASFQRFSVVFSDLNTFKRSTPLSSFKERQLFLIFAFFSTAGFLVPTYSIELTRQVGWLAGWLEDKNDVWPEMKLTNVPSLVHIFPCFCLAVRMVTHFNKPLFMKILRTASVFNSHVIVFENWKDPLCHHCNVAAFVVVVIAIVVCCC